MTSSIAFRTILLSILLTIEPTQMDKIFSEKKVADTLGISIHTLRRWRVERRQLPFVRIGGRVAYREQDIAKFIKANIVNPVVLTEGGQQTGN